MSMRYRGSIMWATLPTVTTSSASGAWTLAQQMQYQAAGTWPVPQAALWTNTATLSGTYLTIPNAINKVIQDSSGNSYFLGETSGNAPYLAKFSPEGTKLWDYRYPMYVSGGTGAARFVDGLFDSSGNLILSFQNRAGTNPYYQMGVAKIAPDGSVILIKHYEFGGVGSAYVVAGEGLTIDSSDNIYMTGVTVIGGQDYALVLKIANSTLNITWSIGLYGYSGVSQGSSGAGIGLSPDQSTVYVTGYARGSSSGIRYGFISRLTASTGSLLNTTQITISGQSSYGVGAHVVDPSGNIYLTGQTFSGNQFVCKLNSSLTPQWGFSIANGSNNPGRQVSIGADGDVYFNGWFGTVYGIGWYGWSTFLARVTPAGSIVYTRDTSSWQTASVPEAGDKVLYLAGTQNNYAQYQRMPADGGGTGIYVGAGSNNYFNYGFGPSLSSVTITATTVTQFSNSLTPSTYTYSGVSPSSASDTYTKTTLTTPFTTASALYAFPGTYTWICPTGVTSVSAICVGGGGGGGGGNAGAGGGGGGLAYRNSVSVTPGASYTVVVGNAGNGGNGGGPSATSGTAGGQSYFSSTSVLFANGGNGGGGYFGAIGTGGSAGGTGATAYSGGSGGGGNGSGGGGGGAGGYAGNGGTGGTANGGTSSISGTAGAGGAGGGGVSGARSGSVPEGYLDYGSGQSGGSVGILGQGANGSSSGGTGSPAGTLVFGRGGGGGGMYVGNYGTCCEYTQYYGGSAGAIGAVRILWGAGRSFPTTNVGAP